MSAAWPPPPDLASIQELVRAADPLGHLKDGAPADEYEPEEEALFEQLRGRDTASLRAVEILPVLEPVFQSSFSLDEDALATVRPSLLSLAKEIERFFGPEAQPRTRDQILSDREGSHDLQRQNPR